MHSNATTILIDTAAAAVILTVMWATLKMAFGRTRWSAVSQMLFGKGKEGQSHQ